MNIDFLPLHEGVKAPEYATHGSAGFDLKVHNFKVLYPYSQNVKVENFDGVDEVELFPGSRVLVGCGFSLAIPDGFEMQVRPRSGLALKQGLTVLNSPGTIDSDYRGEIGVIIVNHGSESVIIKKGEKVAQGIINEYQMAKFLEVKELIGTSRGEGGFGSTGKH